MLYIRVVTSADNLAVPTIQKKKIKSTERILKKKAERLKHIAVITWQIQLIWHCEAGHDFYCF